MVPRQPHSAGGVRAALVPVPEIREMSKTSTAAGAAPAGAGGGDSDAAVAASYDLDSDDALSDLLDSDTEVRRIVPQNVSREISAEEPTSFVSFTRMTLLPLA